MTQSSQTKSNQQEELVKAAINQFQQSEPPTVSQPKNETNIIRPTKD